MVKSWEEMLKDVETEPVLPGTRPGEGEKVRYVSFDRQENPAKLFDKVVEQITPPLANRGGVVLENWVVTLPDGTSFYPISYHTDLAGWTRQIEQGAAMLGFLTGRIESDRFILSDGQTFALVDCSVGRKLHAGK